MLADALPVVNAQFLLFYKILGRIADPDFCQKKHLLCVPAVSADRDTTVFKNMHNFMHIMHNPFEMSS